MRSACAPRDPHGSGRFWRQRARHGAAQRVCHGSHRRSHWVVNGLLAGRSISTKLYGLTAADPLAVATAAAIILTVALLTAYAPLAAHPASIPWSRSDVIESTATDSAIHVFSTSSTPLFWLNSLKTSGIKIEENVAETDFSFDCNNLFGA